ncbi:MAG: hypothetical protein V2B18_00300 [Pseudomonadota bacterium]
MHPCLGGHGCVRTGQSISAIRNGAAMVAPIRATDWPMMGPKKPGSRLTTGTSFPCSLDSGLTEISKRTGAAGAGGDAGLGRQNPYGCGTGTGGTQTLGVWGIGTVT